MVCHDGARAREQHFASIAGARPGLPWTVTDIGITGAVPICDADQMAPARPVATALAVFAASPELYMTGAP